MSRALLGAAVGLCLTGGLAAPSSAWADDDGPDGTPLLRASSCLLSPLRAQISPFQVESLRPDQIPGLSLALRADDGWPEPAPNEYGTSQQKLPGDEGEFASVSLLVYTAENPKTLRDMFADDRRLVLSDADGGQTAPAGFVVSDDRGDYQGHPSWFVRTRTEQRAGEVLCSATERTARDVLVEHEGKTYLVQMWGYDDVEYDLSEQDAPELGLADKVADHVENGLAVEAS